MGLPEILLALIVLAVLSLAMSGSIGQAFAMFNVAKDEEQAAINKRLASVALDYAATISATGKLPASYSSGNTINALYDGANAEMQALLTEARINPREANGDGNGQDRARVYQVSASLQSTVPMYGVSGPGVTLDYEQAVIYSTQCGRDEACNLAGVESVPGYSGRYQASNLGTFALSGSDYGLTKFSTLSIQKMKLAKTVEKIDAIRTKLQEIFRERQRAAAASDITNHYPLQITTVPAASVGTTTDCSAWYRLDNSDILRQIGMQPSDGGFTAWGGQIHYCADYDPIGTSPANTPPHFAALRINKNVSTGAAPVTTSSGHLANNIVISF